MLTNLKTKLTDLSKETQNAIRAFPLTFIVATVTIFLFAFFNHQFDGDTGPFLIDHILAPFGFFFALGIFFIEAARIAKTGPKFALIVVAAAIAALFTALEHPRNPLAIEKVTNRIVDNIITFYAILTLVGGVYHVLKNTKLTIDEFGAKLYANAFSSGIVLGILSLGIQIIAWIIVALFFSDRSSFAWRVGIFCFLMSGVLVTLYSLTGTEKKPAKFFSAIATYVLWPLLLISTVIIYGYMAKILILQEIPSNQVFPILTFLFFAGVAIWTINRHFLKETAFDRVTRWLPAAFVPFVALQAYTLHLRISQFDLTPTRYMGCVLIAIEIIYFILYFVRAGKTEMTLLAAIGAAAIAFVIPGINKDDLARSRQQAQLDAYIADPTAFTSDNEYRVISAYNYLKYDEQGKTYLETVDPDVIESIKKMKVAQNDDDYRSYHSFFSENPRIDVSGFSTLNPAACTYDSYDYKNPDDEKSQTVNLEELPCYLDEYAEKSHEDPDKRKTDFTIDMTAILDELMTVGASEKNTLPDTAIDLPNGDRFVLQSVDFGHNQDGNLSYLYVYGNLLEK